MISAALLRSRVFVGEAGTSRDPGYKEPGRMRSFSETIPWWSAYELHQGDTGGLPIIRSLNHVRGLRKCEL